jgi:hypothetical protein
LWVRSDPFDNKVSLYEKTMAGHISKHEMDKFPTTEEHIYQGVTDPDHARRSLDPVVGHETCVFEKMFQSIGQRFFASVIYDGVANPGDYDEGGKTGHVTTGYFPGKPTNSRYIGEIFWSKQQTKVVETSELLELQAVKEEETQ